MSSADTNSTRTAKADTNVTTCPSGTGTLGPYGSIDCHLGGLVHPFRQIIHGHMERQLNYQECETLKYLLEILQSAKKTGIKR